jgi:uncharacterized protein Veg
MEKDNLMLVKEKLEKLEGTHVKIYEKCKRKNIILKGTLIKTYPNMFLIIIDKTNEKRSYRYIDVLTEQVQLEIDNKPIKELIKEDVR